MRIIYLFVFIVSLTAIAFAQQPAAKPNIVFIFSDDHALQAISAYGSPHIKTPNIDRLAREGATTLSHLTRIRAERRAHQYLPIRDQCQSTLVRQPSLRRG